MRSLTWVVLLTGLATAEVARAQDASSLIAAGRFEEAVAMLSEADSAQAEVAAVAIFAAAYEQGIQRRDPVRFRRAVEAAERLPSLNPRMRGELGFWRGYGIFLAAIDEQLPQTLVTAQATLPKFQEALALMQTEFPPPFVHFLIPGIHTPGLADNVRSYIRIQEAIVRRGR